MAHVFKRPGKTERSNRWYAKIKVGRYYKAIRLEAVWSGPNAVREDKALAMAVVAEVLANKAKHEQISYEAAVDFANKIISFGGHQVVTKSVSIKKFFEGYLKTSLKAVEEGSLAEGTEKMRRTWVKSSWTSRVLSAGSLSKSTCPMTLWVSSSKPKRGRVVLLRPPFDPASNTSLRHFFAGFQGRGLDQPLPWALHSCSGCRKGADDEGGCRIPDEYRR